MSSTITAHFKQQKAHAISRKHSKKAQPLQEVQDAVVLQPNDGLSEVEQELRQFDLDSTYGPCVGLTRLERWERAAKLGLEPPTRVKQLLQASGSSSTAASQECLWYGRV